MKHARYIIIALVIAVIVSLLCLNHSGKSRSLDHNSENSIQENPDSIHFRKLEAEYSRLTQEQLANRKKSAEEYIEKLHFLINSDSLNPEEAHEAMLTISNIRHEIELMNKYLR